MDETILMVLMISIEGQHAVDCHHNLVVYGIHTSIGFYLSVMDISLMVAVKLDNHFCFQNDYVD